MVVNSFFHAGFSKTDSKYDSYHWAGFKISNIMYEFVYVTTGNSSFCLALYLTGVHFRGELQQVGHVSEQKIKSRPIRTREIGGARL